MTNEKLNKIEQKLSYLNELTELIKEEFKSIKEEQTYNKDINHEYSFAIKMKYVERMYNNLCAHHRKSTHFYNIDFNDYEIERTKTSFTFRIKDKENV